MYNLHTMAHQRYEETILEAERQAQFLAECDARATEAPLAVATESSQPLRRPLGMGVGRTLRRFLGRGSLRPA